MQIREKDCALFRPKLDEGAIYDISKFQVVKTTVKNVAVIREFMVYFGPKTVLKKFASNLVSYPSTFFQFLDREKMSDYIDTDKYLIGMEVCYWSGNCRLS